MHDPFPLPAIPALSRAIEPLALRLGLLSLPLHIHEVVYAAVFYTLTQVVVSPLVSRLLFPQVYNASMSRSRRVNWDAHVVSLVQSVIISVLSIWSMTIDDDRRAMGADPTRSAATLIPDGAGWRGRVFGYSGCASMVQSLAAGYFLWDLVLSAIYIDLFGPGMLAHAVSAMAVYALGFRPFLNYYSTVFVLYELSSPFLNIHWFCDKLNLTGSRVQLVNGVALLASFFGCRLVYGNYMSLWVYVDMYRAMFDGPGAAIAFAGHDEPIPVWLFVVYIGSNVTLNSLNIFWFVKMIAAVRKRFVPAAQVAAAVESEKTELLSAAEPATTSAVASAVAETPLARLREKPAL